jgi:Ca2+:H+ antiporter
MLMTRQTLGWKASWQAGTAEEVVVAGSGGNVGRKALLTVLVLLLLLGPLVVVLDRLDVVGELTLFVLAGAALLPLSWLIGEATDNIARRTGPGIGGFLNATFGNAPELIIAIVAISDGLTEVVRASLVGSIAGNLLLVLGFTLLFGRDGAIDRPSTSISLGLVGLVTLVVLVAAVPGFHGDPDRRTLAELSLPLAVVLLVVRVGVTRYALRRQRRLFTPPAEAEILGWPFPATLVVLGLATVVTAFVTETLVGTLRSFAATAHLSEFFVAVVIVGIVGNATEHGSAVMLARRGRVKLAVEIPLASSAQIAGLLIPLVAIVSWGFEAHLAFSFRPVELAAMGLSAALPALVLRTGRTTRRGGVFLLVAYTVLVVAFYLAGDR